MLGQITDAEWVSGVCLEGSLEILHRLLSHFKIVDIRGDLDDSNCGERHRILRIQLDCLVHAELGLRQVA